MITRPSILRLQAVVAVALGLAPFACDAGAPPCDSPEDLGDGLEKCANGLIRRTTAVTCASSLPRADTCASDPMLDACASDADCTAQPNGYCTLSGGFEGPGGCTCVYGCTVDADCAEGSLCLCSEPVGYCQSAKCRTNADCEEGLSCAEYKTDNPGCEGGGFACQTQDDTCAVDDDCEGDLICAYGAGIRDCVVENQCAIGRPFLVEGRARIAPAVSTAAWLETGARQASVDRLDARTRQAIAARWTEIGLMEHASVAAFARFALELCGLGAPPELIEETQRAMADEVRHARSAFSLAARYGDRDVGPGALPLGGVRIETSMEDVLRTLIREGCIGETIAALEAGVGAGQAADPVIRDVLAGIERDEGRHAALAWKVATWLVARLGAESATVIVTEELERARRESVPRLASDDCALELDAFGVLGEHQRAALRRAAFGQVIEPAALALVPNAPARATAQPPLADARSSIASRT